jgi:hypothetical protein
VAHTHRLEVTGDRIVKRYTSWARNEHRREWTVLNLVHTHRADLCPRPLGAMLDVDPPTVTMSLLPGVPLGGALTGVQLDGLASALSTLWTVPAGGLPLRRFHPQEALAEARQAFESTARPLGPVGHAYDAAMAVLEADPLPVPADVVLGHSDPNLTNYLWDGYRVRIVDFEDAGRSDVAYELATLVEHLSARQTDWTGFLARFDVDPVRLREARRLAAVLWLHRLLPGGPSVGRNLPGTLEAQAARLLALCGTLPERRRDRR